MSMRPGEHRISPPDQYALSQALCGEPANRIWTGGDYAFHFAMIFGVPVVIFAVVRAVSWAMAGEK